MYDRDPVLRERTHNPSSHSLILPSLTYMYCELCVELCVAA